MAASSLLLITLVTGFSEQAEADGRTAAQEECMTKLVFDEEKLNQVIDRIVKRTFEMDFEWDWPGGVAFYGVAEAYEATENDEYLELLKNWTDEKLEDGLPKLSIRIEKD